MNTRWFVLWKWSSAARCSDIGLKNPSAVVHFYLPKRPVRNRNDDTQNLLFFHDKISNSRLPIHTICVSSVLMIFSIETKCIFTMCCAAFRVPRSLSLLFFHIYIYSTASAVSSLRLIQCQWSVSSPLCSTQYFLVRDVNNFISNSFFFVSLLSWLRV